MGSVKPTLATTACWYIRSCIIKKRRMRNEEKERERKNDKGRVCEG